MQSNRRVTPRGEIRCEWVSTRVYWSLTWLPILCRVVGHQRSHAQEAVSASFQHQLEEKDELVESLRDARDALEAQLADKEEQLKESRMEAQDVASKRDELSGQLSVLMEKNGQLQEQVDHISGEQYDVSAAQHTRVEELLAREREQAETISKLTQELEDYKYDCAGLWQHNEDLKQQLEAMTASFHAKEQEVQASTPPEQSTLLPSQVSELEHQLELLQQQLDEKNQALSAAQWEHAANEATPLDDSPSPDGDKYVVHSCQLPLNEVSLWSCFLYHLGASGRAGRSTC